MVELVLSGAQTEDFCIKYGINFGQPTAKYIAEKPFKSILKFEDITEDRIREEAYMLWCIAGKPEGMDKVFWFQAIESLNKQLKVYIETSKYDDGTSLGG